MRKRIIFVFVLVVCFTVSGCTAKEGKETQKKIQQKTELREKITQENLMKQYNFSEEDFAGVDICSFLNMYNTEYLNDYDLTELEMTEEEYIRDVLEFYKEAFSDSAPMNYEYLLKSEAENTLSKEKIENIERLAWFINSGDSLESVVFDFENTRIYDGARIDYFTNEDLVGNTDDTIKQKVIQVISEYDIYSWKDYYEGGSMEGTTAWYHWTFAVEFSDGTIYRTGGSGLGDKAYPENMYDFIAALRECEPQNNTP